MKQIGMSSSGLKFLVLPALILFGWIILTGPAGAVELTWQQALDIAVNKSSRGTIISGDLEVARQEYNARRVTFLLPKVSINSSLPSYSVDESFRFFGGATEKSLFKTTDFDFSSNIQLDQSLITGGDLRITANLLRSDSKYPNTAQTGGVINENTNQGFFDFNFTQPLLQPSTAKHELNNRKDDLEIARLARIEEVTKLRKEVTEAYLGVLEVSLNSEIAASKVEAARLTGNIDSLKFVDCVLSEEDWLMSASALLDAELEQFDVENQTKEQHRLLISLLDMDVDEKIETSIPVVTDQWTSAQSQALVSRWTESVPLQKSSFQYRKQRRAADFAAANYGIQGNLAANYSFGRGTVEYEAQDDDDIKTNSWGISINLTYPLWDGGASGASVKAARLSAEKARLEHERTEKAAKAEIVNLLNGIDVSTRKLTVLEKQIELAGNKLDIAKYRLDDGQISRTEYLESYIFFLEARMKYLGELKNYLVDKLDLEGKFIG